MPTTPDFETAQRDVFDEVGIAPRSRFIDLDRPTVRVHVLEAGDMDGDDAPVVFLHSGGTFGALYAPLMAQLDDTWTIALDRPGFGLSDDFTYTPGTYRQTIVDVLTDLLDELGVEQVDIAGNSNGGYWSIVFALTRPERVRRVILLGSLPTFPGTSSPVPLRLYTIPVLNRRLSGMFQASSEEDVIEKYGIFGEGETIREYPALIRAVWARDSNPRSHDVDISEMKSLLTIRGWRSSTRLREGELRDVQQPTLVIWGEDDPLGGPEDVRDIVETIPDGRLETLDTGHVPWLGNPETCAELIREMRDREIETVRR